METKLTKEADKLLAYLYRTYKKRRDSGCSRDSAVEFESQFLYGCSCCYEWIRSDVDSVIRELHDAGLVRTDILGNVELSMGTIAELEREPIDKLKERFGSASEIVNAVVSVAGLL